MATEREGMKNIVKGASFIILGILISKILGYIYRIIVARTGPEPYGLLSLGLALLGIIITFSLLGLENGVLRYVSYYKSKEDIIKMKATILSAIKIALPLSILFSFIAFLFAEKISIVFFHNPQLEPVLKIIAISAPFDVLAIILFQVNRAFQVVKYEVGIKYIGENVLKILLTLIFISIGITILGPALAYTLAIIFTGIYIYIITQKKIFHFSDKTIPNISIYKKMFSFSWPLVLTHFLVMIMAWTDTIMIGYFKNASEVGIYNAAIPTAQILYVIPYAFSFLFVPILTDFYAKKEWSSFNHLFYTTTKWIFMINIIPLIIFVFFSKEVIQTLFGIYYVNSAVPLLILSIGYFMNYLVMNATNTLIIFKKTKLIFIDLLIATFLNIILNYLLIPHYGGRGAAIATSISFTLAGILYFLQAKKLTKAKLIDFSYGKTILAAGVAMLVVLSIQKWIIFEKIIFSLAVNIIIFLGLYGLLLVLLKVFSKEDKELFTLVKKRLQEIKNGQK